MTERTRWPAAVALVTAALALVPLTTNSRFYVQSDTAVQFLPTWFRLGDLVLHEGWPPTLDPGAWVGGNYVTEALIGVYNPVNVLIWVFVRLCPDLLVAAVVVKTGILVAFALGCYRLLREYGAVRPVAALLAIVLPLTGFTHGFDAAAWPSGLMALAYTPWVWWAFRRVARGASAPILGVLVGVLAVTQGNPYGTLAVVVIGLGVLLEARICSWDGVGRLILVGLWTALVLPLVYLPLVEGASLAARAGGPLISDSGRLSASWSQLLGLSIPGFLPDVRTGHSPNAMPVVYAAWFVTPLLPWLRWDQARRRWRSLVAPALVAAVYLVMLLGPSEAWFFRWPLRLSGYFFLALAIPFAVALSRGLARDQVVRRTALTVLDLALNLVIVLFRSSADARAVPFGLIGLALGAVLVAAVLALHRRGASLAVLAAALAIGSGVVLVAQSLALPHNPNLRQWSLDTDVSALRARHRTWDGTVLQVADLHRAPGMLPGSLGPVAGVATVNAYTGMGYAPLRTTLGLRYDGSVRRPEQLWVPGRDGEPPLVDLMKIDRVVFGPGRPATEALADPVPPGWERTRSESRVLLRRAGPTPYVGSRLSWVAPGVRVAGARSAGLHADVVRVAGTDRGGRLVFAMLAWPGYHATLDGRPLPVERATGGLVAVDLPPAAVGELRVRYRPPGLGLSLLCCCVAAVGAVGQEGRRRARSRFADAARPPVPATVGSAL